MVELGLGDNVDEGPREWRRVGVEEVMMVAIWEATAPVVRDGFVPNDMEI